MKNLSLALIIFIAFFACAKNISSSQLKSTKAGDLKVTASVEEINGSATASVNSLLKTMPDEVGVKFNQGEVLSITSAVQVDPSVSLSYNENFLDLGEQYTGSIAKPALGGLYTITYRDADRKETTASFSSKGVADLQTPTADQEVFLGESVALTWSPGDLGALRVEVTYDTLDGGHAWVSLSTSDTGAYTLDLSRDAFADAATGSAVIRLVHYTIDNSPTQFNSSDIKVRSVSRVAVVFKRRAVSAALKVAPAANSTGSCAISCQSGEDKKIHFKDHDLTCCGE